MKRKAAKAPDRPPRYMAGLEIERAGIRVQIAEVPSQHLAAVVAHALEALKVSGMVTAPDEPTGPLEAVGGYAPLDVKDDPYEQGKRPKRVGF